MTEDLAVRAGEEIHVLRDMCNLKVAQKVDRTGKKCHRASNLKVVQMVGRTWKKSYKLGKIQGYRTSSAPFVQASTTTTARRGKARSTSRTRRATRSTSSTSSAATRPTAPRWCGGTTPFGLGKESRVLRETNNLTVAQKVFRTGKKCHKGQERNELGLEESDNLTVDMQASTTAKARQGRARATSRTWRASRLTRSTASASPRTAASRRRGGTTADDLAMWAGEETHVRREMDNLKVLQKVDRNRKRCRRHQELNKLMLGESDKRTVKAPTEDANQ